MSLTKEQKDAAIAAAQSIAMTAAGFNPAVGATLSTIVTLSNLLLQKGNDMTMEDFRLAVAADDAAIADDLLAQEEARHRVNPNAAGGPGEEKPK